MARRRMSCGMLLCTVIFWCFVPVLALNVLEAAGTALEDAIRPRPQVTPWTPPEPAVVVTWQMAGWSAPTAGSRRRSDGGARAATTAVW